LKHLINIINQVFEIEKKSVANIQRNVDRIKIELEELGYTWHNPDGEKWDETRTDCEANISGKLKSKMVISNVVKPIIYQITDSSKKVVQKAIVVVE
jgi:hypothetical protein